MIDHYSLYLAKYDIVEGNYGAIDTSIGLFDNFHLASEVFLEGAKRIYLCVSAILIIEFERLRELLQKRDVEWDVFELDARVSREIH